MGLLLSGFERRHRARDRVLMGGRDTGLVVGGGEPAVGVNPCAQGFLYQNGWDIQTVRARDEGVA